MMMMKESFIFFHSDRVTLVSKGVMHKIAGFVFLE